MSKIKNNKVIQLINVSKQFKVFFDKPSTLKERIVFRKSRKKQSRQILNNINLTIDKGEVVAIIGSNGSGKSTLLKMITKIIVPSSGKIITDGKITSLLELGAGFHPDFTGRENIYFNASIFGLSKKEIDNRLDDIISFAELKEFIDSPVRTYSSGMYMRLAFSIAINVDADILLIDEILAVGDQRFQEKCFQKLLEVKKNKKTIVIVSHNLDVLKRICDRTIWLNNGQIYLDGKTNKVIEKYLKECDRHD